MNTVSDFDMMTIEDYIVVMDDLIPKDFCHEIIEEYKDSNFFEKATVGSGLDENIRNCDNLSISHPNVIAENFEKRTKLDKELFEYVSCAIRAYKFRFPTVAIDQDTGYILLRYNKGQFYHQHTDSFMKEPRAITMTVNLNDDFKGGEFAFFDRRIVKTLKAGDALLFPSNFMYPHEITEVTEGIRYSIVTWFR